MILLLEPVDLVSVEVLDVDLFLLDTLQLDCCLLLVDLEQLGHIGTLREVALLLTARPALFALVLLGTHLLHLGLVISADLVQLLGLLVHLLARALVFGRDLVDTPLELTLDLAGVVARDLELILKVLLLFRNPVLVLGH